MNIPSDPKSTAETRAPGARVLLILVCLLHLGLGFQAARLQTPTVDEFAHLPAGLHYWQSGNFELYSKNPPLVKLWLALSPLAFSQPHVPELEQPPLGWGPWLYGQKFEAENAESYFEIFTCARIANLLLSLGAGLVLFFWGRRFLKSEWAASAAAAGFLLSPTVLAHASLATVDIGACFAILGFAYFLSRAPTKLSLLWLFGAGLLLGAACGAKFTGVFLLPWWFIWLALRAVRLTRLAALKFLMRALSVSLLAALIVFNASYGFRGPYRTLSSYTLTSASISHLVGLAPDFLGFAFPQAAIVGFDAQTRDAEQGEFGSYLLGEWSQDGWWYYNLAAFAMKETLLTLALLAASFGVLIRLALRRRSEPIERAALFDVFGPLFFIGLPLSALSKLQIGVRYLLPVYPFLFLLAGVAVRELMARSKVRFGESVIATAAVLVWLVSDFSVAPDFLTYFNSVSLAAAAGGEGASLLLDSNFDWGQDLYRLKGINSEAGGKPIGLVYFGHVAPSHYGIRFALIPDRPVEGLIAVSANFLKGYDYVAPGPDGTFVHVPKDSLAWLRGLKPIRREGSIYVFDTRRATAH